MLPIHPPSSSPVRPKVVVIDDDAIIQRAVFFALREQNCTVLMCSNVAESLTLLRRERPHLIVLDIHFPPDDGTDVQRNGYWAVKWLGQVEELKDTPVIMTSVDDPETAGPRCLAAGAQAFLPKPINKEELVRLALELVQKKPAVAALAH